MSAAALVTILLVSFLVVRMSAAAFTATTSSAANSWATGSVALTNSASASAAFDVSGMVPGQTVTRCITVTYTGTNADIRMYGGSLTDSSTLADDLSLTVSSRALGALETVQADCSDFGVADETYTAATFPKSLTAFNTDHFQWSNGLAGWTPTTDAKRVFRIAVQLSSTSTQSGQTAGYVFSWQAEATAGS